MYSRPPDKTNSRIKIPDNYNGNAFGAVNSLTPRYSEPHNDVFSDLPDDEGIISPAISDASRDELEDKSENIASLPLATAPQDKKNSTLSSLLPSFIGSGSHFPFGHGIGSEEMLILAMMAMIFMSESETDNYLLLLLGLLLFAG
jgi:hypothetical protein